VQHLADGVDERLSVENRASAPFFF
jgi:hypothetical protein